MISPPRPALLAGTDLDRGARIFTRLFAPLFTGKLSEAELAGN
jgi:hypothetical protein